MPPQTSENPRNLATISEKIDNTEVRKGGGEEVAVVVDDPRLNNEESCKVYGYRWIVLFLFVVYSSLNAFQWIQFSIITDIVVEFYGVSAFMVDMTSMIYMIAYVPLIFPGTIFLERKGLRLAVILGSFGTALGSWIKVLSAKPDLFYVAFIGQTVVAISQTFILSIPPLLAAVWFGPDQVSTATSIGVFGNQLGIAAGFLLPTLLVKSGSDDSVASDLRVMFYGTGIATGLLFVAVMLLFREKPPTPPSPAQMAVASSSEEESYFRSMKNLMTNRGYILLLISYGMNVGVFYAISTLLSSFIAAYFPEMDEDAGRIGLLIVVSGMVGSVIAGLALDKTKKYKETTLALYLLSFVCMIAYTFTLRYGNHIAYLYVVFCALGFFMTGYLPVGFEFAAEITHPESEGTSSGLLNASVQVFGIILTPVTRALFESSVGDLGANLLLSGMLLLGVIMTTFIRADLRRTAAQNTVGVKTNDTNHSVVNSGYSADEEVPSTSTNREFLHRQI